MPYLIAIGEVGEDGIVEEVVGVGYEAYAGHGKFYRKDAETQRK